MSTVSCLRLNKRLIQTLFLLLICLASLHANITFASDISNYCGPDARSGSSSMGHINLFQPCPEDFSVGLLQQIFGTVSPVLASSNGTTILGVLLHIFASIIMPLCVLFAGYATLMGIINSAADGEAMGRKMSSIWIPIRTSAGLALLLPLGSGYCAAQAFILWVCLQGIGAADYLWGTTAQYFAQGGSTGSVEVNADETNAEQNLNALMVGLTCRQYSYLSAQKKAYFKAGGKGLFIATGLDSPSWDPDTIATTPTLSFNAPSTAVNCNAIQWTINTDSNNNSSEAIDPDASDALLSAINAVLPTLNAMSYQLAVDVVNNTPSEDKDCSYDPGNQTSSKSIGNCLLDKYSQEFYSNSLLNTWAGPIISAAKIQSSPDSDDPSTAFDQGEKYGWISAGGLYYKMVTATSSVDDSNHGFIDSVSLCTNYDNTCFKDDKYPDGSSDISGTIPSPYNQIFGGITEFMNQSGTAATGDTGNNNLAEFTKAMKKPTGSLAIVNFPSTITAAYMGAIFKTFASQIQGSSDGSGINPIVAIASAGHKMVHDAQIMYAVWFSTMVALGAVMGLGSSLSSLATIFKGIMSSLTPVIMAYTGIVATLGGGLAIYVPLIPFMIFSMAVIGWLISMVEANIAMPICAAFLAHPEGHEVWGKIEPTTMLIINMFLRPSLLIIGLVAAMVIAPAAVSIINFGIGQVISDIYSSKAATPMEALLIMTLYVTIITSVLNKVFGTIHKVPDQVMRWVAGGEQAQFGGGTEQDMGAIGQGSEKGERLTAGGNEGSEKGASGALETGSATMGTNHAKKREQQGDQDRAADVAARDKAAADNQRAPEIEDEGGEPS